MLGAFVTRTVFRRQGNCEYQIAKIKQKKLKPRSKIGNMYVGRLLAHLEEKIQVGAVLVNYNE